MGNSFGLMRFLLVMSSLSPVFVLWGIRGVSSIPDLLWIGICGVLFSLPNILLQILFYYSRKEENVKTIEFTSYRAHSEQLITYLLAMMLPLIEVSFNGVRDSIAAGVAFMFTLVLFCYMNLHYMNLFFIIIGYRLYEVTTTSFDERSNGSQQETRYVIISRQKSFDSRLPIKGFRLGANVLMELSSHDQKRLFPGGN